jgi:hypothetical protein
MKNLSLFIDESGSANPRVKKSPVYIVAGCMIDDHSREKLKIEADQIKFKFWSTTGIVLHSREIGRKEGVFKILSDRSTNSAFQKDLFNIFNQNSFQMLFVLVDNKKALLENWNHVKVYEETANLMVRNFILSLITQGNIKGRLVIESASSEKDFYFHKAAGHYLSHGIPELNITYNQVQSVLTEISFVTKKNHDVEEQVADLLAYAARLKFLRKNESSLNAYEKGILKVLKTKLFRMNPETKEKKKKYLSQIDSFKILP